MNKKDKPLDDGQDGKGLWEILEFRNPYNYPVVPNTNGEWYMPNLKNDSPASYEDVLEAVEYKGGNKIHSVRRLSDNEVFTIGDDVTASNNGNYKIARFFIKPDDMMADLGGNGCVFLKYLRKKIAPALPVADAEGEKVGPAPDKLETPNDLIKSLNWCKNLLSSITAASIAGRDLGFVKHGTPFFEEMLMAYKSAKAVLAKPLLPSAVTGGVKDALKRISKYEVDDGKLSRDMLYEVIDIATKALSEGQPE